MLTGGGYGEFCSCDERTTWRKKWPELGLAQLASVPETMITVISAAVLRCQIESRKVSVVARCCQQHWLCNDPDGVSEKRPGDCDCKNGREERFVFAHGC